MAGKVIIAEKFWHSRKSHYAYSTNNTFTVNFEKIDDFTIFIMINYKQIINLAT